MKDILSNSGMRWTKQRQQIYDVVCREKGHYTAEDIWTKLSGESEMGLSTVYRTLQLLEEKNIIKRLPISRDTAVYESCDGISHGHHHMHCNKCGRTLEIHVDMLDDLEKIITTKYKFTVTGHTVLFTGLCDECASDLTSYNGKQDS